MHFVRNQKPTAAKITASIQTTDFASLGEAERQARLDRLISELNRLEFEERQKLQVSRSLDPLVKQMTDAEKFRLVEATLPQGFKQLMESLNKMTPEQRKRFVQRGMQDLDDARTRFAPQEPSPVDEEAAQRFIQQGFQSYLENASSETKMDLAPLLEQIQINLQGLRP
jgi:hypothetical protein